MLKSFYKTLDEIPEGDRQHYKKIGDRHVLELDGEHPVQAQVTTITEEKRAELAKVNQRAATAEAEVARLKVAAESQPTLPSGHVAVPADEAKVLDSIRELGEGADLKAKVEHVKTRLTEHAILATENATLKKGEQLRKVADTGFDGKKLNLAMLTLLDQQAGGLTFEERDMPITKDGKTTTEKVMSVKDGNKWVPLAEHFETHWKKDFGPALLTDAQVASTGTRVVGQRSDDGSAKTTNFYDDIRKAGEEKRKAQEVATTPLEKRLNMSLAQ
jgi:hypothetical protein